MIAYLIVLLDLIEARDLQKQKQSMSLLFLANSWFGMLELSEGGAVGFEDLLDLSHVAQSIWKANSTIQENE